ncbi:citrate synthase, glyoxysomal-like [Iris pallida]|uniref:Citrate synthase, glyoxysomal-like n=1 Tax=Iris pallida TaxID=29817 RepID=A0AAX6E6Q9_IRIPA|nr:citrate synthase, glyoxysomal-like [Iris pallida]
MMALYQSSDGRHNTWTTPPNQRWHYKDMIDNY